MKKTNWKMVAVRAFLILFLMLPVLLLHLLSWLGFGLGYGAHWLADKLEDFCDWVERYAKD